MAGYSSTPLGKKLGYKPVFSAYVLQPPTGYRDSLQLEQPDSIRWLKKPETGVQLVHLFTSKRGELEKLLPLYRKTVAPDGAVWVSWPKKASGVATDITEDRVRDAALPLGFVDIKVCAVDDVWSGLKLVIRRELR